MKSRLHLFTRLGVALREAWVPSALIASLNLIPAGRVTAHTFTTLHGFTAITGPEPSTNNDGAVPSAGLILSGNTLYGSALYGGSAGWGTVFKVNTDGTGFTNLHSFEAAGYSSGTYTNSDGVNPIGDLILSGNTLYGTANGGGPSGSGTVFAINTDGTGFTNLHRFDFSSDGASPRAGLTLSGNTLYGTASGGGSSGNGTVFAINTDGTGFTNLHSFNYDSDGAYPRSRLIISDNTLYGTSFGGGSTEHGTVFAISTDGTGFTNLHRFTAASGSYPDFINSDGVNPDAGLIISGNTLYGTASGGGSSGRGTVFKVNTNGTGFTNLYSFTATSVTSHTNSDGANPYAGLILSGNTLYGTAFDGGSSGRGTVFAVTTNGTGFMNLHSFADRPSEGARPFAVLVLSGNTLYGTTEQGGTSGYGTVFGLSFAPELTIRYVNVNNASPAPPYTNWTTAATTIQDAVDAAVAGDQILVTNGVYQTGGRVATEAGAITNRVAVTKALMVRSVNGAEVTVIQGYRDPDPTSSSAVRCVYLANDAALVGFTLTNGSAGYGYGGGVWCESARAVVSNCVLTGNSADQGGGANGGRLFNCTLVGNSAISDGAGGGVAGCTLNNCTLTRNSAGWLGGGAYNSTLNNCTLSGNSAADAGGAYLCTLNNCMLTANSAASEGGGVIGGTLNNCTLSGNSANEGGGAYNSTLNNCIVYFNSAPNGDNYYYSRLSYSCTTPLPPDGVGNISAEPQLADLSHLSAGSPCRGAGSAAYATGVDIDEETWANSPSIGCDEFHPGSVTGPLSVSIQAAYTNLAVGVAVNFTAAIDGRTTANRWDFDDGTAVSNRPYASHSWAVAGDYSVVFQAYNDTNPDGVSATVIVHVVAQPVHYVALGNTNPVAPYTSWATAADNIQDVVDAASVAGALVLVTNGIYRTGERAVSEVGVITSNRVAVTKALIVRSVNGAAVTVIQGYRGPHSKYGEGGVRCVYLANGAALVGFTLTNGAADYGGGVWCESTNAIVSNCVLTGNSAYLGGGASGGTLTNCRLSGNSSIFGGGASGSTLNNCTLTSNSSSSDGGGANVCTLNNCTLNGNSSSYGGGAAYSALNNCTLSGNSGGGATFCTLNNCIVYYNSAPSGDNYSDYSVFNYTCTTPLPTNGIGNITNAPLFVDYAGGNLRLQSNSPCINAGFNASAPAGPDLDGNPRIIGGTVDMGAYEFQSPPLLISSIRYVNVNSASPAPPYTNWTTAATTIQDAVDAAVAGDQILVTNGVYQTGGRVVVLGDYEAMTNRVAVTNAITLRSVNGAAVTVIKGHPDPDSTYSDNIRVRCVYLANGAALVGFTLTNGAAARGGGVWCESASAVVSNCVVTGNSGGGANGGTLYNCTLNGNSTGIDGSGGGASDATLNNCTVSGNSAYRFGGGANQCTLNNCTLNGNSAYGGGGVSGGTLNNCIVYYNSAPNGDNYGNSLLNSSSTTPLPANGVGNLTNAPLFVNYSGGNLRLQSNSPCINAGSNTSAPAGPDLDGNPRIVGGTVDIGAYEFQAPQSLISYAWLLQYGLPTDGSADATDTEGDRLNNWQEWRAGTDPKDALSVLRLLSPASGAPGVLVSWQSVGGRNYFLERAIDLGAQPTFLPLATGIVGRPGTTMFTDTNAVGAGPFFYRVGAQE